MQTLLSEPNGFGTGKAPVKGLEVGGNSRLLAVDRARHVANEFHHVALLVRHATRQFAAAIAEALAHLALDRSVHCLGIGHFVLLRCLFGMAHYQAIGSERQQVYEFIYERR